MLDIKKFLLTNYSQNLISFGQIVKADLYQLLTATKFLPFY